MAISFGNIGSKSAGGTTTISVAYPAGVAAGSIVIAGRSLWPSTATADDEAGWTKVATLGGGTGSAIDDHTTRVSADYLVLGGGESGSVTFDQGNTPDGCLGAMGRYANATGLWDVAGATGDDATHGANRSATSSTNVDLATGDMVVVIFATDTDASLATLDATLSASGITFDTVNRRSSGGGVTTGQDGNMEWIDGLITAGSGTVAITTTFTNATSQCGPAVFIRLRETTGPPQEGPQNSSALHMMGPSYYG